MLDNYINRIIDNYMHYKSCIPRNVKCPDSRFNPLFRKHKVSILFYLSGLSPLYIFCVTLLSRFLLWDFHLPQGIIQTFHHTNTLHRRVPCQDLVAPICHIMPHHHSIPACYLNRVPYQHIATSPCHTSISSRNTLDSLHHCIAPPYHTNIQSQHPTVLYQVALHHHYTTLP